MAWPEKRMMPDNRETFTVSALPEQAARWRAIAALEKTSIGYWLADAADARAKEIERTGIQPELRWSANIHFRVGFSAGQQLVEGLASGPFGIFRGGTNGPEAPGCGIHSLVHRPSMRVVTTLARRRDCMTLAAELSALNINWEEEDANQVLLGAPDEKRARTLIHLFSGLAVRR